MYIHEKLQVFPSPRGLFPSPEAPFLSPEIPFPCPRSYGFPLNIHKKSPSVRFAEVFYFSSFPPPPFPSPKHRFQVAFRIKIETYFSMFRNSRRGYTSIILRAYAHEYEKLNTAPITVCDEPLAVPQSCLLYGGKCSLQTKSKGERIIKGIVKSFSIYFYTFAITPRAFLPFRHRESLAAAGQKVRPRTFKQAQKT